ncbi:MAG: cation transporter [Chloroflexi bacterium]|nr:cation transporter [Chloroflexota bacterium]
MAEIVGGLLINSVAILSDALHDLGDSLSLELAWYLEHVSEKQSDTRYSSRLRTPQPATLAPDGPVRADATARNSTFRAAFTSRSAVKPLMEHPATRL